MKLTEYNRKLDEVSRLLDKETIDNTVVELLDDLYNYKPVSPRWHQLKCKSLMKQGNVSDIITRFGDKVSKEYTYDGNTELWSKLIEAYRINGQVLEGDRQSYMLSKLTDGEYHIRLEDELFAVRQKFMEGDESIETILLLEGLYYKTCNRMMAYAMYLYGCKLYPEYVDISREEIYLNIDNMAYISEYIADKKTVVIIVDSSTKENYDILSYVLHALGMKVYMVCDMFGVDEDFDMAASVQVSFENAQKFEDCIALTAIARKAGEVYIHNNIPHIIDYICKHETEDDFVITFAANDMLDELRIHEYISKRFERLSCYEAKYVEKEIGYGRAGDYYTYISGLYGEDVRKLVDKEPECEFSIVVPVRNATDTLYHTLRTCIEQDFKGSYEILLSDNSVEGHTVAYETYIKLNDKHLRYIKTPRALNLTKSFEYAYLHTKGKYIISIGADDGLLPWALRSLAMVWAHEAKSNRYVVVWSRGFYAWPGFNGGQQNQLTIPRSYIKDKIDLQVDSSSLYLSTVLNEPSSMYILPNTYINSGFHRGYLKYLYEKTGCILDGLAQDIYMGLTNIGICKDVLQVIYPISIAGMSDSSVGSLCNKASEGKDCEATEKLKMIVGGRGIYAFVLGEETRTFPHVGSDVSGMYISALRLQAKNILPKNLGTDIESLKNAYFKAYQSTTILGDKCFMNVLIGYEKAKAIGGEFTKWYEQTLLPTIKELRYITPEVIEEHRIQKKYKEGPLKEGGLTVDASKYGVTNIYEAVQLFIKLIGFEG